MAEHYTRNHIRVQDSSEGVVLAPTEFLTATLGDDVEVKFRAPGARVERGGVFGRALGGEQACSLFAPVALIVEAQLDARQVRVRVLAPEHEPYLSAQEYRAFLSALPK